MQRIPCPREEICDSGSHNEGILEITVSDSGHGIPETIHDKIFLPFYTTKDRGTGLGLAIAHKIVVSHRVSFTWRAAKKERPSG